MENGRESLQNLAKHASTWEDILAYAKQHYGWLSSGTGASLIRYHDQMYVFINHQYVHGTESKDIHEAAQANSYLFEIKPGEDSSWTFQSDNNSWTPPIGRGSLTVTESGEVCVSDQSAGWNPKPPAFPWKKIVPAEITQ